MQHLRSSIFCAAAFSFLIVFAQVSLAQITEQIDAHTHHSFIVGNATLPPGQYVFRMMQDSGLQEMTVTSRDGDTSADFLVRDSIDSHVPRHTELVFNRYGNKEFLANVYQIGAKTGVAVIEPSREESRLLKQGQAPVQHTEEQEEQ